MEPLEILGRALTSEGKELVLYRRDDHFQIRIDGLELMANVGTHSEKALAEAACDSLTATAPRVLIGGLGLGFTLRSALDRLPENAQVIVAELLSPVIEWNRGPLSHLAAHPLRDPRVTVRAGDVAEVIAENQAGFDAILLDIDNGPKGLVLESNNRIYGVDGIRACGRALRPSGCLAVWCADAEPWFEELLVDCGFRVEQRLVRAQGDRGPCHSLYLAYSRSA